MMYTAGFDQPQPMSAIEQSVPVRYEVQNIKDYA
jgi:hypothetical protein